MFDYNNKDKNSIYLYAKKLANKSISQLEKESKSFPSLIQEEEPKYGKKKYNGKGGFGNFLEERYFGKKNDSESQPDFPEAGIELKTSPLKVLKNGEIRVKERLVLNHFTYFDIVKETFEKSHFIEKNSLILIVFYFYKDNRIYENFKIDFSDFWECIKEDYAQIQEDWNTIVNKIKEGKAHEISEGDTVYLGACTKGANKEKSMQNQPFSDIPARGRALCFKTNYINQIYRILKERQIKSNKNKLHRIFENKELSFQENILNKFNPYLNLTAEEICKEINYKFNPNAKAIYASIARKILNVKRSHKNEFEFQASGIQIKAIRVEPNLKFKESISFPALDYCEIIDENWLDSTFYNQITSKFIFVIFRHNTKDEPYYLDKVFFWNVPEKDMNKIEKVWKDTKEKIKFGNYNNFVKMKSKQLVHIRPHDTKGSKPMITPQGDSRSRICFWLNNRYIQEEVIDKIYKLNE